MNFGLCCISNILKDRGLSFRTITKTSFFKLKRSRAEEQLREIIAHNFSITEQTIAHCMVHGIRHYRLSSSIMPLVTCLQVFPDDVFQMEQYQTPACLSLKDMVQKAIVTGMSFSSHPGQFTVLGSKQPQVVESSIRELVYHVNLHDALGLPQNHSNPINIHVSNSPKNETVDEFVIRFIDGFVRLPSSVQNRLTLENEDKGFWNCQNLYTYFGGKFVLCYDNLHHQLNSDDPNDRGFCSLFTKGWKEFRPVFHLSEQAPKERPGAHADFITAIPLEYQGFAGILEVEVKAKDRAILQLISDNEHQS